MSAYPARRQTRRLVLLCTFLMSGLVGCGDSAPTTTPVSTQDPRAGSRRKEMLEDMKKKESGGATKGTSP
jgi:hypothetical protein